MLTSHSVLVLQLIFSLINAFPTTQDSTRTNKPGGYRNSTDADIHGAAYKATVIENPGLIGAEDQRTSYFPTCNNYKIKGNILYADCQRFDGSSAFTALYLGECLVNHFGEIQPRRGGHFENSCTVNEKEFNKHPTSRIFYDCGTGVKGQKPHRSEFDLNWVIENNDGHLECPNAPN